MTTDQSQQEMPELPKKDTSISDSSPEPETVKDKTPISKTAVLALLLALTGIGGVGGLYYLAQQELVQLKLELNQQTTSNRQSLKNELTQANQQALKQTGDSLKASVSQQVKELDSLVQSQIQGQNATIAKLGSQLEPQDWLAEEAEYLLRLAGRNLWLEKNTETAVALLKDADKRLAQLDKPALIPVRQAIHQDIEQLNALPKLNLDEMTLALIGLEYQAKHLKLANIELPESAEPEASTELSEDISDWQANLKKSWDKFLADFITVRRRAGATEALMTPKQQDNLRFNMALKLQQAQWAVSRQNQALYRETLNSVANWLQSYYDMNDSRVQEFAMRISELHQERVDLDYPKQLSGLQALRDFLSVGQRAQTSAPTTPAPKENTTKTEANGDQL